MTYHRSALVWVAIAAAALVLQCGDSGNGPDALPRDVSASITSTALGCSNFTVYRRDSLMSQFVVVSGDTGILGITTEYKSFDLALDSVAPHVYYDVYPVNKDSTVSTCFNYCDPTPCTVPLVERWYGEAGTVEIKRGEIAVGAMLPTYKLAVRLLDVQLRGPDGATARISAMSFDSVVVGWLPD
jgi:hypothetical protein